MGESVVKEYFAYDNDGKLLYKETGSEKHYYIYANGKLWCEIVEKGNTKKTYYHHTDHLGTTVCITDSTGKVVWNCEEGAFGNILSKKDSSFTPNFTGKFLDENTGLYYFNARWYDADMGRFIIEDPARDGRNWFVYCENNPVIYTDPDGRIQRKKDNSVVFFPSTSLHKEIGNSNKEIQVCWGYIKANNGSDIKIRINFSKEFPNENFNCHGYTFTDGLGWVQPDQIEALLQGDNYIEQESPSTGGIFIQYDKNGIIKVKETFGAALFKKEGGKLSKIRDFTYKISEMESVKFYKNDGEKRDEKNN